MEIDENNKLWRLPYTSKNIIFSYDDIISYELLQNGESITKGGLGSAIVGGAMFGGAGTIVGGITGSKKTKQEISEFRIKIITRNPYQTEVYVNFVPVGKVKTGSILFMSYNDSAQRILSQLALITDSASNATSNSSDGIPDEIVKYKKLLDQGIITQEEFDAKKRQLLQL